MIRTFTRVAPLCAVLASCLAAKPARAQNHPFPTSGHYGQGVLPAAATAAAALSSYKNWKAKYLLSDCGNSYYRVNNPMGDTFSEGQGYGMVLTAYFGDKTEFDGLWAFAQKNFTTGGLMGWHVTCGGFASDGNGTATDGDEDIGFGLIVAAAQWGGSYAQTAKSYLATLKSVEFTTCNPTGRNVPNAGDWDKNGNAGGGCMHTNTSYWTPGYYRVFGQLTGDTYWGKAADDVVALYNLSANPMTGIIIDEVDQNGVGVSGRTFDYNSCRIPWRAALEYLWYGTPGAQQWMNKLSGWVNSVGIKNTVDGYNANGTPTGQYTGLNAFVGGFASGAVSGSQSMADAFGSYFVGIQDDNGGYYGSSLRTLYLLMLSGNQWNPLGPGGSLDGGSTTGGGDGGTGMGTDAGGTRGMSGGSSSGSSGAGSGGLSGSGSSSSGGAPGSGGASEAGADDGGAAGNASSSKGCGCRLSARESDTAPAGALAALLALVVARRTSFASRRRRTCQRTAL
jgi:endo-1,4-beta-D-glucanase Y